MPQSKPKSNSIENRGLNAERWLLVAIILLATFLRLYLLDDKSLWGDEINVVSRALGKVSTYGSGNAFLYYPLLNFFIAIFGQSDYALRLPAVLVSLATIPLIYKFGQLLFNKSVGVLSAFFLAISVFHINYSQEVHSYTLFAFLSLLSLYLLWLAVYKHKWIIWLAFGLVSGLNIAVHFYGFFVLLSELLIGIVLIASATQSYSLKAIWNTSVGKQRPIKLLAAVGIAVLVNAYALIRYIIPQFLQLVGLRSKAGRLLARDGVQRFEISPELFETLFREFPLWKFLDDNFLYQFFWGGLLVGLVYLLWSQREKFSSFLIWLVAPLLPVAVFAQSAGIDFATRRFIFILPICFVIIAFALVRLGAHLSQAFKRIGGFKIPATSILALAVFIYGWFTLPLLEWYYYQLENRDWKRAAILLEELVQPDDIIITQSSFVHPQISELDYYYSGLEDTLFFVLRDDLQLNWVENQYSQHRRLWYVRKLVEQDNLQQIENWIASNDFLTFSFGGGEFFISYKRNEATPETEMLGEWEHILQQAIELKPDRWYLYEVLAQVYIRQNKLEEAVAMWEQFLADNPEHVAAYLGLAKVHQVAGDSAKSLGYLRKVADIAPDDLRFYDALSYILKVRGENQQELDKLYRQLETIDPSVAHFALALFYAKESQHRAAIQEFQTVIALDPRSELAEEAQRWLELYE